MTGDELDEAKLDHIFNTIRRGATLAIVKGPDTNDSIWIIPDAPFAFRVYDCPNAGWLHDAWVPAAYRNEHERRHWRGGSWRYPDNIYRLRASYSVIRILPETDHIVWQEISQLLDHVFELLRPDVGKIPTLELDKAAAVITEWRETMA